ncbi:hypothetical protein HAX54_039529 [Datura stramonium]|uniref:Uncharacterized protein n=1 Tax=Datura stramonium TaxID=4076 RepID=A0ABS8VPS7_DATST|nr:hypothetical protein [Datura stramonium]
MSASLTSSTSSAPTTGPNTRRKEKKKPTCKPSVDEIIPFSYNFNDDFKIRPCRSKRNRVVGELGSLIGESRRDSLAKPSWEEITVGVWRYPNGQESPSSSGKRGKTLKTQASPQEGLKGSLHTWTLLKKTQFESNCEPQKRNPKRSKETRLPLKVPVGEWSSSSDSLAVHRLRFLVEYTNFYALSDTFPNLI